MCSSQQSVYAVTPVFAVLVVTWDQRYRVKCYTSLAGLSQKINRSSVTKKAVDLKDVTL